MGRIVVAFLGVTVAAGVGAVSGTAAELIAAPPPAQAASSVGGTITRSEVLERAQFWVDQGFTYGTVFDGNGNTVSTQSAPDPAGKNYRTDCSGLVSMAWHLTNSPTTTQFQATGSNPWDALGSVHDLKPGDAMVHTGHIELFAFWKSNSDHSKGAYVYSFNSFGETVQNPYAQTNHGHLGFNSWSDLTSYTPIRYANIQDDPLPVPPAQSSGAVVFNGVLYEFARGADQTIKYWFANGGSWSATQTLGSSIASDPVATVHNGFLYLFAIGTDGTIKYWFGNGGLWSAMQTLSVSVSGGLSSTVYNDVLYLFARGTDGGMRYWFANGGPWSATQTLGGTGILNGAVATGVFNGTLFVFANGTDSTIKYWFASGGAWSATQTLGGSVSGGVSSTEFNGVLYVFARGTDGGMKYWFANGGPWSGTQTVGASGTISGGVSSAVFNGVLYIFGRGTDGTAKYWFANGGTWSAMQSLGGGLA